MVRINIKAARDRLSSLLDLVQGGDEVILLRHGKAVARLTSPAQKKRPLPSLKDFRKSIRRTGKSLSAAVIQTRKEERY